MKGYTLLLLRLRCLSVESPPSSPVTPDVSTGCRSGMVPLQLAISPCTYFPGCMPPLETTIHSRREGELVVLGREKDEQPLRAPVVVGNVIAIPYTWQQRDMWGWGKTV